MRDSHLHPIMTDCSHSFIEEQNRESPDFAARPLLPRSTSKLKIRDHINTFLGYDVDSPEIPVLEAPCVRTMITTHEQSMVYKHMLHMSRARCSDPLLYYKWSYWEDRGLTDIVETEKQLKGVLKALKRALPDTNKVHVTRMGIHPNRAEVFKGEKLSFKVGHHLEYDVFKDMVKIVVGDFLYRPMDVQSMCFIS